MATPQNNGSSFKSRGLRINRMIQTTMNDLQNTRLKSRYGPREIGTPIVQMESGLHSILQTYDTNDVSVNTLETTKKCAMSTHKQSRSITPSYAYGYGEISLHKDPSLASRSIFKKLRPKMSENKKGYNKSIIIEMSPSRICIEDYIKSSKDGSRFNKGSKRRNVTIKNNFMVPPSNLPANYVYEPAYGQRSNTPILKYIQQQ